ncbi:agmatine deiminase [Photobacterium sp. 1_MG-2023]|uniref:agmatine deiminase n=1 Tax=Photobacterium sp. 1_MG-2023 TaxID=3062646 RepID=UPI0026E3102B|nr:agmatine deiminase [Photobacterium sp. 1_MG-2023]MDO6707059.1 agmatine deiminase [Photobacterium sp. 1_MG-2023]
MELQGTPLQHGFYFPAEFAPQEQVWLAWPERPDNWRENAKPAQLAFVEVATAISQHAQVSVVASPDQFLNATLMLPEHINVVEMPLNDAWIRDIGPTIVINDAGERRGISWQFNAWGGEVDGLYAPWDDDDRVAAQVCEQLALDHYRAPFVLEGGAIHTDGEGTLYTTKECLLSAGRNPHLTQAQIEAYLAEYLSVQKIIWLPDGLFNDETNGHVDNLLHVIAPAEVVLSWCDDPDDPQYEISRRALAVLENATDAQGRAIKVHKILIPGPLSLSESEAAGIDASEGMKREAGERLGGSYANFLMCNQKVFLPLLDSARDQQAIDILKTALPDYEIIGIPAREILLGGGNIHCITQQIPHALASKTC